ncbi:hypothetical protein QEH59_05780 [Coraliomargarita sp. SDUM461004]|uniref:DUF11 domain-containing protein n=1 Tax=Thalassobacterium sedimentorum TaxID=3041258 RepID=A0ABU1AH47_9BACT|nr:hypothetical protein [Coraliomargarita sp. SDUM461004]MDQ8193924.1 hypothetical protein [Coraliomargarita sp. SDUM461004]
MKYVTRPLALFCGLFLSMSALAAQSDPLVAQIDAYIVTTDPDSAEVLELAEVANPGDIILYRATFKNQSDTALTAVQPVIPIPAGLEYIEGSAKPAPQEVSLDGITFESLSAVNASGEPVDTTAFRALRWSIDALESDVPFTAELRARLVQ